MNAPAPSPKRPVELVDVIGCSRLWRAKVGRKLGKSLSLENSISGKHHRNVEHRAVYYNCPGYQVNPAYANNHVTTAKYNVLTFLPKTLFEQYRRAANVYFTFVAVLSFFSFSPVSPVTTISPLLFVLGIAITKEGVEDHKRHQSDREVNHSSVDCWEGGVLTPKRWEKLCPGDLVVIRKNQQVPADVMLLSSSLPDGICYVETMNLDGETNLKLKKAKDETLPFATSDKLLSFEATIECEPPDASLYTFSGNLKIALEDGGPAIPRLPLNSSELLLRGSSLRNTDWATGIVVYAGHQTKVFQNSTDTPSKRSTVERRLDRVVMFMFVILFFMCAFTGVMHASWTATRGKGMWYAMIKEQPHREFDADRPVLVFIFSFLNGIVLYGYLIPISLYVSVEIAKATQALYFINFDADMHHRPSDTWAQARTSNLNEELGNVQIIMSDKTGTLTQNVMEFFRCSIAGVSYGQGVTEVEIANARRLGEPMPEVEEVEGHSPQRAPKSPEEAAAAGVDLNERGFNCADPRLLDDKWTQELDAKVIEKFMMVLAVCHTIVPEGVLPDVKFQAESPDELAFAVAAKAFGFTFHKRTANKVHVKQRASWEGGKGLDLEFEVVAVLEFSSERKRMSVIVRDKQGKLVLLCKGADNIIYERLRRDGNPYAELTQVHLDSYASAGLRTLCLAYADIEEESFAQWLEDYKAALTNPHTATRRMGLAAAAEKMEKELILLGATAIEDKLQDGVPDTIRKLTKADIGMWMLTGDKLETAVNISYACSLIHTNTVTYVLSSATLDAAMDKHDSGRKSKSWNSRLDEDQEGPLDKAARRQMERSWVKAEMAKWIQAVAVTKAGSSRHNDTTDSHFALVVEGSLLLICLRPGKGGDTELRAMFLGLALECQTVVCCRVSPLQKAQVTSLVKGTGLITLAIGDGANDVGMIQVAHLGIGISGHEGRQATMASDYSIGQFRFLAKLLLVHGRWNYRRIVRVILYFFYKNVVFGVSILFYNALSMFSGFLVYDAVFSSTYNVLFTFLPVIALGTVDQDVSAATSLKFPQIYRLNRTMFTLNEMARWFFLAIYQTIVLTWGVLLAFSGGGEVVTKDGKVAGVNNAGMVLYTAIIVTVNMQLASVLTYWNWILHFCTWISITGWFFFVMLYGAMPLHISGQMYKIFLDVVAPHGTSWLVVLLTVTAAVLPDMVIRMVKRLQSPSDIEILQEYEAQSPHKPPNANVVMLRSLRSFRIVSPTKKPRPAVLAGASYDSTPIDNKAASTSDSASGKKAGEEDDSQARENSFSRQPRDSYTRRLGNFLSRSAKSFTTLSGSGHTQVQTFTRGTEAPSPDKTGNPRLPPILKLSPLLLPQGINSNGKATPGDILDESQLSLLSMTTNDSETSLVPPRDSPSGHAGLRGGHPLEITLDRPSGSPLAC